VVFAVGDRADEAVGLPCKNGSFVTNPNKTNNDPDDALFQAYDDATGTVLDGTFLTGWARKASEGLVGVAKRDGEWTAEVVFRYLESQSPRDRTKIDGVLRRLETWFSERNVQAVTIEGVRLLEAAEREASASQDCIGEFKFATNQEMLALIQRGRDRVRATAVR
jgi:ferredoxin--NADP+ reductase